MLKVFLQLSAMIWGWHAIVWRSLSKYLDKTLEHTFQIIGSVSQKNRHFLVHIFGQNIYLETFFQIISWNLESSQLQKLRIIKKVFEKILRYRFCQKICTKYDDFLGLWNRSFEKYGLDVRILNCMKPYSAK